MELFGVDPEERAGISENGSGSYIYYALQARK